VSGGGSTTIVWTDIGVAHTVEEPLSLRLRKAEEVKQDMHCSDASPGTKKRKASEIGQQERQEVEELPNPVSE
jgi:hypothetical protein